MGVFRQFPYSNFHEMNMDEIIKIVKNMLEEWAQYYAEWDAWMTEINDDWSNYQEVMNEAWQNMQDFINDYFDNLDVQNEINNKITSMVNSGEFATIVGPYIPPRVTAWLAENITQPVGVVIDTSLTVAGACADAKATGDAIIEIKDDFYLNEIPENIEILELQPSQVADALTKGVTITQTGINTIELDGTATEAFNINIDFYDHGIVPINKRLLYFFNKRSDGIIKADDMHISPGYFDGDGNAVPTNDKINIFNSVEPYTYPNNAVTTRNYLHVNSGATFNNVEFTFILLEFQPLPELIMNGMLAPKNTDVPINFVSKTGYYDNNGNFNTYSNIWGTTVAVDHTKEYTLNFNSFYGMAEVVFFDATNNYLTNIRSHNDDAIYTETFYAPQNSATMLIQAHGVLKETVEGRTSLKIEDGRILNGANIDPYTIPINDTTIGDFLMSLNTELAPLLGKHIAYDGDSICESRYIGVTANGGAYPQMIADITGGTFTNEAVSGGVLASVVPGGTTPHSVVNNLGNLPDADLYCIEGGLNDFWLDVPLGDYSPTNYSSTVDTTTVCGALEHIIRSITYYHVTKPMCFVFTHDAVGTQSTNNAGYTFTQMREKMIGICKKYAIPFYDAYTESGLNGYNSKQNETYLTAGTQPYDGIHPNADAYKRFYVPQLISLFKKIMPIN